MAALAAFVLRPIICVGELVEKITLTFILKRARIAQGDLG
jgi:hypothetical protein